MMMTLVETLMACKFALVSLQLREAVFSTRSESFHVLSAPGGLAGFLLDVGFY